MGRAFFSELSGGVEAVRAGRIKQEAAGAIRNLDAFIRSGVLSSSKNDQFILRHYDWSVPKITEKWNKMGGKTKSGNTFRCQKGLLGSYVASIFGLSPNELSDAVALDTEDAKGVLERIRTIILFYGADTSNLDREYSSLFENFDIPDEASCEYGLADCEREMQFLRTVNKESIGKLLDGVNRDKLTFVLNLFQTPIVSSGYEKSYDGKTRFKRAKINEQKLELCKRYLRLKPAQLETVEFIGVDAPRRVGDDEGEAPNTGGGTAEDSFKAKGAAYRIGLPEEMAALVQAKMDGFESLPNSARDKMIKDSDLCLTERYRKILSKYTVKGFEHDLENLNLYALREAVKSLEAEDGRGIG